MVIRITDTPAHADTDADADAAARPARNMGGDPRQEGLWPVPDPDARADGRSPWGEEASSAGLSQDAPGPGALRPPADAASPYSNFEQEEESVWSRPGTAAAGNPAPAGQGQAPPAQLLDVPDVLRPGGPAARTETNPFKRKLVPGSARQTADAPPTPTETHPPVPTDAFSALSLGESSNNPWGPVPDEKRRSPAPPPLIPDQEEPGKDIWSSSPAPSSRPSRQPSTTPLRNDRPALLSLPSGEEGSPAWDEVALPQQQQQQQEQAPARSPAPVGSTDNDMFEDRHAWEDLGSRDKGKAPAGPPVLPDLRTEATGEGWSLIDDPPALGQLSKQSTWDNFVTPDQEQPKDAVPPKAVPKALPALPTPSDGRVREEEVGEEAPLLPPRSPAAATASQQRPSDQNETYQIKNITWYDVNAAKNPRTSPILVQNANGPCPLLALVNALTLTTPADMNTALVDTLRSREQVSLGLLLDAVFDELMSPRRTNEDSELPDVTELYAFLKGLHTGMNVNPRFIPTPETATAFKRTSLTHLHPVERGDLIPGTFEDTKEMKLYSTFSIPLIHGWIPPKDDAVYGAFTRQAQSYEDVQNLLFREEELEEKLSSPSSRGLSEEEQEIYQDILTIKSFLSISATQLTPWGLEVITKATQPGAVAILFRNDHFATLYRHPQTRDLVALVTDAGYAGHEEVVWESLIDVNGEHSEFFSGDFREVGGAQQQQQQQRQQQQQMGNSSAAGSSLLYPGAASNRDEWPAVGAAGAGASGWTTVQQQGRRGKKNAAQDPPQSPMHEQEDRDLALALQLQEEEEERHRTEEARRKRESLLSEQFIEQQARQSGAIAGPRSPRGNGGSRGARGGGRTAQSSLSVNQRRSSNGITIPIAAPNGSDRARSASVTTTNNRGGAVGSAAGTGRVVQTVRSLVPPVTHRPADDGVDDAPPSYEHAARQAPYTPPAGHPSHPASSPTASNAGSSTSVALPTPQQQPRPQPRPQPRQQQQQQQQLPPLINSAGRTNTAGSSSSLGRGYRQGVPPPVLGVSPGPGKDRDCVVM